MKISKEDFDSMQAKYDQEVKKGKPGKGVKDKDKDHQLNWVFFDRATLEGLLAKVDEDPTVGGIQFYITQYTEETAKKVYPNEAAAYAGQLTVVMRAANLKDNQLVFLGGSGEGYVVGGIECPFLCEPAPTES
ncbi:molecular chaperone DnaK [Algoriphagus aquimarinus]|uniref:molecular chaperone DnaK n=1 Tax=Algoriphagus aquimarinus TaxID=237018 RepID=UPI0030D7F8AA|tara:strand:+ start:2790 stop:3188 length:399 start_codon:yes stop_codon:yes gene_type:complete